MSKNTIIGLDSGILTMLTSSNNQPIDSRKEEFTHQVYLKDLSRGDHFYRTGSPIRFLITKVEDSFNTPNTSRKSVYYDSEQHSYSTSDMLEKVLVKSNLNEVDFMALCAKKIGDNLFVPQY